MFSPAKITALSSAIALLSIGSAAAQQPYVISPSGQTYYCDPVRSGSDELYCRPAQGRTNGTKISCESVMANDSYDIFRVTQDEPRYRHLWLREIGNRHNIKLKEGRVVHINGEVESLPNWRSGRWDFRGGGAPIERIEVTYDQSRYDPGRNNPVGELCLFGSR